MQKRTHATVHATDLGERDTPSDARFKVSTSTAQTPSAIARECGPFGFTAGLRINLKRVEG